MATQYHAIVCNETDLAGIPQEATSSKEHTTLTKVKEPMKMNGKPVPTSTNIIGRALLNRAGAHLYPDLWLLETRPPKISTTPKLPLNSRCTSGASCENLINSTNPHPPNPDLAPTHRPKLWGA